MVLLVMASEGRHMEIHETYGSTTFYFPVEGRSEESGMVERVG